ncbi:MAG: hypothetical protein A3F72_07915 [Bacteroidetes bacterium RIFCSPLOWO2_12_FULL_35_15]|nr:MAG: hypothetical protein A3F72_07915 [Bacteroidetes bacterium RIFCSPLOWO2_12_FULL_35_15]
MIKKINIKFILIICFYFCFQVKAYMQSGVSPFYQKTLCDTIFNTFLKSSNCERLYLMHTLKSEKKASFYDPCYVDMLYILLDSIDDKKADFSIGFYGDVVWMDSMKYVRDMKHWIKIENCDTTYRINFDIKSNAIISCNGIPLYKVIIYSKDKEDTDPFKIELYIEYQWKLSFPSKCCLFLGRANQGYSTDFDTFKYKPNTIYKLVFPFLDTSAEIILYTDNNGKIEKVNNYYGCDRKW